MRNYPRLSIERFGEQLLETGDLDPVYVMLNKVSWPDDQLYRFCIAYWCFYSSGVAAWIAQRQSSKEFWNLMRVATENVQPAPHGGRWERGHERRHFRGDRAIAAIDELSTMFSNPLNMPAYLLGAGNTFEQIRGRVLNLPQFGPWMAFKIADMLERCFRVPVSFTQSEVFMYRDPREAAIKLWLDRAGLDPKATPKEPDKAIYQAVNYLLDYFKDYDAPPHMDRKVNLQEIETILCKWKSHMNGHYPLLNDTTEIKANLKLWADTGCSAAKELHSAL